MPTETRAQDVLARAHHALSARDPEATVEFDEAGSGLRVHSSLEPSEVLELLQRASLPVAAAAPADGRSDCCGGCCGA